MIRRRISDELLEQRPVLVDFTGVTICIAAFLNAAIGRLYGDFAAHLIEKLILLDGADDLTLRLIARVAENSKEYYSLSPERRSAYDAAIRKAIEDN